MVGTRDWSASTIAAMTALRGPAGADLEAHEDVSMASRCTYRVGGPAAVLVTLGSHRELERLREAVDGTGVDVLIVGKGSNLLVADRGFDGIVVELGEAFDTIDIDRGTEIDGNTGRGTVVAGGAASLPVVARRTVAAGLTGFEWAVGVPGSIGGAVRMNAGGHGSDMAASLVRVTVFDLRDGGPLGIAAADLDLGYRSSNIAAHHLVTHVELSLAPGDPDAGAAELSSIVGWRRANQPGGQNAGSVFANPEGDSAGRLIDAAGLKGFRIGTASVSDKHANFIQADPGGSADDVHALIRHLQRTIADHVGVDLRPENRLIGFELQDTDQP